METFDLWVKDFLQRNIGGPHTSKREFVIRARHAWGGIRFRTFANFEELLPCFLLNLKIYGGRVKRN